MIQKGKLDSEELWNSSCMGVWDGRKNGDCGGKEIRAWDCNIRSRKTGRLTSV